MRLIQTVYIVLTICSLLIGIHQSWLWGLASSYWIFMFMAVFLFLFRMDVNKHGIAMVDEYIQKQKAAGKYPGSKPANTTAKGKKKKA